MMCLLNIVLWGEHSSFFKVLSLSMVVIEENFLNCRASGLMLG